MGRYPRYGICLDSLAKIPANACFDVVVLDESEQVLAHFLAETMDRGGGSRDRIFVELRRFVRQAKTVIAMDADLGWVTFRTLSRLDPRKPKHIWFNEGTPGADKTIQVYQSQPHLVAELKQALTQGKRCFVTSNAKGKIVQLARAMKDDFPAKAFITITADTGQDKAVKDFISNPSTEALKYDAVFASPSIGTGVDIAFPDQAQVFDAVFGFCEAQITTHLEFDQQRTTHTKDFKAHVFETLRNAFGDAVSLSKRAIKMPPRNTQKCRRIVAFEYRRYNRFGGSQDVDAHQEKYSYILYIQWLATHQLPKRHLRNLTQKHQGTNGNFKPAIRIFKNLRSKLILVA